MARLLAAADQGARSVAVQPGGPAGGMAYLGVLLTESAPGRAANGRDDGWAPLNGADAGSDSREDDLDALFAQPDWLGTSVS